MRVICILNSRLDDLPKCIQLEIKIKVNIFVRMNPSPAPHVWVTVIPFDLHVVFRPRSVTEKRIIRQRFSLAISERRRLPAIKRSKSSLYFRVRGVRVCLLNNNNGKLSVYLARCNADLGKRKKKQNFPVSK